MFCMLLVVCSPMLAQTSGGSNTFEGTLQNIAGDAAKGYVAPIVSGFGSDLNGGWFHKSPSAKMFGFDLEFGLIAMGTTFKDENKTFSSSGSFSFNYSMAQGLVPAAVIPNSATISGVTVVLTPQQKDDIRNQIASQLAQATFNVTIGGPTIIGATTDSVRVGFSGLNQTFNVTNIAGVSGANAAIPVVLPSTSTVLPISGYLENLSLLPLGAPQLSLGTIVGTQVTFRYLPEYELDAKMGKFKYFGWGLQHNPGIWFPNPLPINICASFFTQKLDLGTVFSTTATAYGINISKTFGPGALNITPYAGFMLESSKMTFTYTSQVDIGPGQSRPVTVNFELEGENTSRITLGLSLKLLFININADYNIAKYNSLTGGVMFII